MLKKLIRALGLVLLLSPVTAVSADSPVSADADLMQGVISRQLDAFARGDATTAFAQASPVIQAKFESCLLYTSPSPRDRQKSRMPSSA